MTKIAEKYTKNTQPLKSTTGVDILSVISSLIEMQKKFFNTKKSYVNSLRRQKLRKRRLRKRARAKLLNSSEIIEAINQSVNDSLSLRLSLKVSK